MVDVIGFLQLKFFAAHVTGNMVLIAALLAGGRGPRLDQALAIPTFIIAVAVVRMTARRLARRGPALARPLLLMQLSLLTCVLIASVTGGLFANPGEVMVVVAGMLAVSAMACQYALLRLMMPVAPSTAVMTGNLTYATLSLLDLISGEPIVESSRQRLKEATSLLAGFFLGCIAGAAAVSFMGDWSWSLSCLVGGAGVLMVPRKQSVRSSADGEARAELDEEMTNFGIDRKRRK